MESYCPQCNSVLNAQHSRLVQDSCGHKKCRLCLLKDESECFLCVQAVKSNLEDEEKCESNHTTVITSVQTNKADTQLNLIGDIDREIKKECVKKVKKSKLLKGEKRSYKYLVLPSHIKIVSENPSCYTCTICSRSFGTKAHVKYHQYCLEGPKPFGCGQCEKKFTSKYRLEMHVRSHSGKTPFTCEICNKGFIERSKLKRHQLCHTQERPYVCQQCGKTFRAKETLNSHTLNHGNKRTFSCSQCNSRFNNPSNLRKHIMTHSKEKAHMCDQCGKRFKIQATLKIHRKSHTKIRSHNCTLCPKSFVNLKELRRHELIHMDIKAYTCSICSTSFRRKDNLERHLRNTHPGKNGVSIKKDIKLPLKLSKPITDNPNAINVIKPPLSSSINEVRVKTEPVSSKQVSVINAPFKLAFKTSAFKNHYNILSREYVEEKSVNIYQKILEPCSSPPVITKTIENDSTSICQKIFSPIVPPIDKETFFDTKPHAIRNIKFKLPTRYQNLSKNSESGPITPLKSIVKKEPNVCTDLEERNDISYTELKPVCPTNAPGVIVNTQNEMHWRRRTLQNLSLQMKLD